MSVPHPISSHPGAGNLHRANCISYVAAYKYFRERGDHFLNSLLDTVLT